MQRTFFRLMLLYIGGMLLQAPVWGQEDIPEEAQIEYQADTAEVVARRLAIYNLCKQQNNPTYKKLVTQAKGEKICFTIEYQCEERGSSGTSKVYQTQEKCISDSEFERVVTGDSNSGGESSGGTSGHDHDGGGIVIDNGSDFCSGGVGCGPCAGKCQKFFYKGKNRSACIKCLERNGLYCLASLLSGNRSSCSQGSVRYSCSTCSGSGGTTTTDTDIDCSHTSRNDCTTDHKKRKIMTIVLDVKNILQVQDC